MFTMVRSPPAGMSSAADRAAARAAAAFEQNASVLDIAYEEEATRAGLPFLPAPPPPRERPATLVGVAVLDRGLRYRRVDAGLAALNGRSVADCLGKTLAEVRPDLAETLVPLCRRVLATGEPVLSRPIAGDAGAAPGGRRRAVGLFPLPPGPAAPDAGAGRAGGGAAGRGGPAGVVAVVREVDAELTRRPVGVSDERFRELVTRATVGLAQVDPAGRFLYVNDRFCAMTGWPRGKLVGVRTQQSITHPRDAGANAERFAEAVRDGAPYLIDKRYRRPDGRSVWVRNTVTVLPGPDGAVESMFAVAVDMTDRVRTERALRRSQERLRLATEAGGLGVWAFDLEKGVADWSPEALAIYGGGFDGRPSLDELRARVHPDDRPAVAENVAAADPGAPARRIDLTHRVVHPPRAGEAGENGAGGPAVRWVRSLGEVRFDADGRPARSAGVLRDVTEEREAEGRLAESERRLRQALAAADLGTWEFDAATGLSDWDARTCELFGVADDFRAGKRLYTHEEMLAAIHPADRGRVAAAIPETLDPAGAGKYEVEHRVVRPDGTERLLAVNGEAEFAEFAGAEAGPDRRAVRVTGTVQDVTARRAVERRLAESADRLALAAEAAALGAYEIDLAAGEVWWDARTRGLHGVPDAPETAPLADALAGVHPDDRPDVEAALADAHAPGGPERFQYEYRLLRSDGSVRWARAHGTVRFEPIGPGGEPVAVRQTGYVQDITAERARADAEAARAARLAEQAARLAQAEERQRLAVAAAELGLFTLDVRTGELWWDARSRAIFEFDGPETCRLAEGMDCLHPDDEPGVAAWLGRMFDGSAPARDAYEYRVVLADGSHRWVRSLSEAHFEDRPDGTREAVRMTGCLQDVTAAKRTELALAEAKARLEHENDRLEAAVADRTAKLRTAAGRIGEVARQERDRIARVLHDHLQQTLVGAKMNLAVLGMSCEGPAAETVALVAGLIDDAIAESRALSAELTPPILRSAGLAPALHWLAEQFERRHGLPVEADCDEQVSARLDESAADLLFGAARECLLNVVKHADAGAARLRLDADDEPGGRGGVTLTVADDGRGFDPAARAADGGVNGADGFGMSDLRQRVDLLGGEVAVRSAPGGGCEVRVFLPLG